MAQYRRIYLYAVSLAALSSLIAGVYLIIMKVPPYEYFVYDHNSGPEERGDSSHAEGQLMGNSETVDHFGNEVGLAMKLSSPPNSDGIGQGHRRWEAVTNDAAELVALRPGIEKEESKMAGSDTVRLSNKDGPTSAVHLTNKEKDRLCQKLQADGMFIFDPLQPPPPADLSKKVPLTLPWTNSVSTETVLQLQWVRDLQLFLATVQLESPVAIVASNAEYTDQLLNWLISALVKVDKPLKNVLVVATNASLHQLLQMRGIASVHIVPHCIAHVERAGKLTQVEIPRVTVMRILNYWGYDVVNYDADAIIIKNPQPLYDRYKQSDIIGTAGKLPTRVYENWGVTICLGVVMTRATYPTGMQTCSRV